MKVISKSVYNINNAMRAMRMPLQSFAKSDSTGNVIGPNDLKLAKSLIKCGSPDRKFLRQIFVSIELKAPVFWLAELDTYKVGVTRNSSSFMHTGTRRNLILEDFEGGTKEEAIDAINAMLEEYREHKTPELFEQIRANLPMGYLYKSVITMNYENVLNMILQREHHRLSQWRYFCEELKQLPYMQEFYEALK